MVHKLQNLGCKRKRTARESVKRAITSAINTQDTSPEAWTMGAKATHTTENLCHPSTCTIAHLRLRWSSREWNSRANKNRSRRLSRKKSTCALSNCSAVRNLRGHGLRGRRRSWTWLSFRKCTRSEKRSLTAAQGHSPHGVDFVMLATLDAQVVQLQVDGDGARALVDAHLLQHQRVQGRDLERPDACKQFWGAFSDEEK